MYSYYIQKSRPYHVRICTLIPLCHTLNPFLLGTEQENIIFLCGKQRKDNKFWGISWGWSPRDILRNLSSFLSFLHKNVILFNVLRTRICILVLETFILLLKTFILLLETFILVLKTFILVLETFILVLQLAEKYTKSLL